MSPATPNEPSGSWDSIHVFETVERGRQAHYKLTSTVMLQLTTRKGGPGAAGERAAEKEKGPDGLKTDGEITLSGSMTRQVRFWTILCEQRSWTDHDACDSRSFGLFADRTGLAYTRCLITHHQYGQDDRGNGDQDAEFATRGAQSFLLASPLTGRTTDRDSSLLLHYLRLCLFATCYRSALARVDGRYIGDTGILWKDTRHRV